MPIVDQHTERLKQLYGDYCIAEIIEYPGTNDRKTLVCEVSSTLMINKIIKYFNQTYENFKWFFYMIVNFVKIIIRIVLLLIALRMHLITSNIFYLF